MEEARSSKRKASGKVNDGTLYQYQVGHSYFMEVFESVVRHNEWVTGATHGSSKIQKVAPSSRKRKAARDEISLTSQNNKNND
jgi:hypothetical protein